MSSMTLEQLRSTLDEWGCSSLGQVQMSTELLRKMRDAIDAHLAGMGEPVATSCADHVKGETGYCTFSAKVPWGTRLFAAPSIDLAAVRDVIDYMRLYPYNMHDRLEMAEKLEAAIKGVA